jgi:dipeptidyl-peptidase-4
MLSALMMLAGMASLAGEKLTLEEITSGVFRQDYMQAVRPMADGETYSQISDDGKQVVTYSFRTGKQVSVLFDAATARGAQIGSVDNYIMSPDGK